MTDRLITDRAIAYQLHPGQGAASLRRVAQQRPVPGPRQVVVAVRAASLNRRDLMLADGSYPLPATPRIIPLSDGVGEVVAVGDEVGRTRIGDRVSATYFVRWIDGPQRPALVAEQYGATFDGMLAGYAVLEEDSVVAVPEHLTDVEAAALPCAGVVAWAALTGRNPVRPGQAVVTVGTGPVGLFAVQFAHRFGARVVAVTSQRRKADRLRSLGADAVVFNDAPDWHRQVLDIVGSDGAEHIVDAVGLPTLPESIRCGGYNADLVLVGAAGMASPTIPNPFPGSYLAIRRIAVGSRTDHEAMNRAVADWALRPVVDRVFAFEDAPAAYDYYRSADPFGKVVVASSALKP